MHKYNLDFANAGKPTPAGNKFLKTYTLSTLEGREKLECTGKTNIYDMIQADLEESKIENIIKRVMLGDLSVLRQSEPQYIDASTIPNNMMEVQNIIVRLKQEFQDMPTEVKELFHNSPEEYVNEMGTKQFLDKMSPYVDKIAKIADEKNAKEYEKKVKDKAKLNWDIKREEQELEQWQKATKNVVEPNLEGGK